MSRPGRWISLLVANKLRHKRWLDLYIHHRNLYNKGEGEIGFVRRLFGFQTLMIAWLFVRDIVPTLPIWIIGVSVPILLLLKCFSNWFIGWWWDRKGYFAREHTWNNKRDPIATTLNKKVLDNEGIKGGYCWEYIER